MNNIEELIERDINFQTHLQDRSKLREYINIRDELINLESIYGFKYLDNKYNINSEAALMEVLRRIKELGSVGLLKVVFNKLALALTNLKRNKDITDKEYKYIDTDKFYKFINDERYFITVCNNIKVLSELCEIGKNIVFTGKTPTPETRAMFGLAEGHFNRLETITNHFDINIKTILKALDTKKELSNISDVRLLVALPANSREHYVMIGCKADVKTELPNKRRNLLVCGKIEIHEGDITYMLKPELVKEMITNFLSYRSKLIQLDNYSKNEVEDALKAKDEFLNKDEDTYAMNDINFALSIIGENISINKVLRTIGNILIKYYRTVTNDKSIEYIDQ